MRFPFIEAYGAGKEMSSAFMGYEHTPTCHEGAFYDTQNITTELYPVLSPRRRRGIIKTFTNFQGMIDKEGLVWVDNGELFIDNVKIDDISLTNTGKKLIEKMGAYIIILPDNVWYNTADSTHGSLDNEVQIEDSSVTFTLCGADGTAITWHDASYYNTHTPQNGDYKMETVNGKTSLSVYSSSLGLWSPVATTYMKIGATGIGEGFEDGDGVKVTVDLTGITWDYAKNVFVNDEGDGKRSNNFVIKARDDDYIIVPALLDENKTLTIDTEVSRKCPEMSFIVECQNRLWGCKPDGHEIYCCKLGDVKNWNVFAGISTDSWRATIGSDGAFTGVANYMGYPLFFKEDSIIRVSVSAIGAHSTKETICRGVEAGSEGSLVQLNEVLLYKAVDAVCVYDGSFPSEVSRNLGQGVRYSNAKGGSINNRYYINMKDADGNYNLFVYDIMTGLWAKEDNVSVVQFERHGNDLYFVSGNKLYSVNGTLLYKATTMEEPLTWKVESGNIGYDRITNLSGKPAYTSVNDKKRLSRLNIRMQLGLESHVALYLKYDSSDNWEHQWDMSGKGTKTFNIPVRPRRCDHFAYKLVGHGDAKVFSITKTYTEGSDK